MKVYIVLQDFRESKDEEYMTDIVGTYKSPIDAKKKLDDVPNMYGKKARNVAIEKNGWLVTVNLIDDSEFRFRCVEEEVQ